MVFIKKVSLFFFLLLHIFAYGQEVDKNKALARQYYTTGNYEKAAVLYEVLFLEERNMSYYSYLFNSLLRINEYDKLEKIIKKQIRKQSENLNFLVDLGYVYSQNNQAEKAKKQYELAISKLSTDEGSIRNLAYKFISLRLNDYLVKTYEKGNQLFNNEFKFAFDMGDAYLRLNETNLAAKTWLDYLEKVPLQYNRIQSTLSRNLAKDGFPEALEEELYSKIQEKPNKTIFPEILIWLFSNQKDFKNALIQAKALDRKQKEEGFRIMQLAKNASNEQAYDEAIEAYEYLLSKGENNRYHFISKSEILNARKQKIIIGNEYIREDLEALKEDYNSFLTDFEKGIENISTIQALAKLEAKYLDNTKEGIRLLKEALTIPNIKKKTKNALKLDLGDFYVLTGDVWEAILVYEQVNKDERDSPLGEDARFRSAKVSYYTGEFEWAQAQLSILKGATTELIANDALDLSVFIIDNLGLDTSTQAMELFAEAELLIIQNKLEGALDVLNNILTKFPQHALTDDVLMKKAKIALRQKKYSDAALFLTDLLKNYSDDILGDNATFMLAEIYEQKLNNKEKAKSFYEKIILNYSDSVLLVAARKRYRKLRGDEI